MAKVESAEGPHAVLTPEQIANLWEAGYAVIPRGLFGRDPYAIADAIKRPGMAQQWGDKPKKPEYLAQGWRLVVNEAWPGLFAPYGAIGDVEIDGLVLMQKPQHEVDRVHAAHHAKAQQNVDDWIARQQDAAFSVGVHEKVGKPEFTNMQSAYRDGAPTIDTTVGIPRDMMPHVSAILAERDRLCDDYANGRGIDDKIVLAYDEAIKNNPGAPKWPTLRAIVLPTAIENVRANLKQGGSDAETEDSATSDSAGGADRRHDEQPADAGRAAGDDAAVDAGKPATPAGQSDDSAAPGTSAGSGGDAPAGEPRTVP